MGERLRGVSLILGTAFRTDPRRTLAVVALTLARALGFVTMPFWLKLMTNGAIARDIHAGLLASGAAAASLTAMIFAEWLGTNVRQGLQERTGMLIEERLARFALDPPGIQHYEYPEYANQLRLLREERELLGQSLSAILEGLQALVSVTITVILLASVHPALLALPLFGAAFVVTGRKTERVRQGAREQIVEQTRAAEHLFDLATSAAPGKELRIFALGDEFLVRHEQLWRAVDRTWTHAAIRGALWGAAGWLLFVLGYAGAIAFVVALAVRNDATVGDVLLALGLAAQINGYVSASTYLLAWLLRTLKAVRRLLWLEAYSTMARPAAVGEWLPVMPRLERGVNLDGISFRYPGTATEVLRDVHLHLPAGSIVALVGENGAGKTTLVKLLCRLYEPTTGRITVDRVDLRQFAVDSWRTRVAAAFQDAARFEFLVRETVGVGDLMRLQDAIAVETALRRAGAEDLKASLPAGLETQLGTVWEGGVELSGGQWQKLALGRAMMRQHPLLLVLDEPAASLDAQTEHDLFERYAQVAQHAAAELGTITLLVTHRFSTVRMADLIIVLERGRVTEVGNHEELLAKRGLYAELYELQARAYR